MSDRLVQLWGDRRSSSSWSAPEDSFPLTHGPRYIRQPRGWKWHIPRDGRVYPPLGRQTEVTSLPERIIYGLWCGGAVLHVDKAATRWNHPPTTEMCGNCMGQAITRGVRKASDFQWAT